MKVYTVTLRGRLTDLEDYTFEYPFGAIQNIGHGRWEFAISAISIIFTKQLAWNSIYEVSTNYMDSVEISDTGVREQKQMTIGHIRIKGQPRDKVMLGYKWRDYFEITNPTRIFTLTLKEIRDPESIPPRPQPRPGQERSAYISILVLFRRIE